MKTIKKIFFDDVVSLAKNFFALTIVVGICFLPALYAWFNIYSNWDPYGNTGALKFAAVSLDEGFTTEDGEYHNQGDTIIENLHENTAVDWQFVESSDEAIEGVYSGKYYAAVVVDKDFTYNMYNVLTEEVNRPTLLFYENQKKNPVATKISDTVVQTLQNNINVAFTEVVVSRAFSGASELSAKLDEKGGIDSVVAKLESLSADLTNYQNTINQIIENDAQLQIALGAAETDVNNLEQQAQSAANAVANSSNVSQNATTTINNYANDVNTALNNIMTTINELDTKVQEMSLVTTTEEEIDKVIEVAKKVGEIKKWINNLPQQVLEDELANNSDKINEIDEYLREQIPELGKVIDTAAGVVKEGEEIKEQGDKQLEIVEDEVKKELINEFDESVKPDLENEGEIVESDLDVKLHNISTECVSKVSKLKDEFNDDLIKKVDDKLTGLTSTLNNANSLLNSVGETFGNLGIMFAAIDNTVDCANTSLQKTNEAISYVNGRLIELIDEVDNAATNDKAKVLANALSGDPELYGKFFSTPVDVETEAVYPIENYGSAVAPFYSTLAFWVGALILTAIIKIQPDKNRYPGASPRQLFFGRYVLYWVLGQIQAVVIVLGDLFLLHVQCVHPWLFLLAASFIATTFTILIYSLVVTWGDVGKALSVVIVVIQIAGSSGTYPIELLPEFFKKMYIFFPFPYAINAIRECLCGLYELDYLKYLGCLIIFIIVALVIGLLVRIPFEPINHYMEERMEDTEMM